MNRPPPGEKEEAMEDKKMIECTVCYYRENMARFTPITVSADLSALECPKCLNNTRECFSELR
jgi:hypothetical protein